MNVLLIDDDATFRFIAKTVTAKSGGIQIIKEAKNGADAIEYIKEMIGQHQALPDLILLDLNMPVMDGWTFLDTLPSVSNGQSQFMPIVILTSSINTHDREKSKCYSNVKGVFTKPITVEHLDRIRQILDQH